MKMTRSTIGAAFLLSLVCAFSLQAADGNASKDAFVLPGDVVIPQIATGGDGTEGIYIRNGRHLHDVPDREHHQRGSLGATLLL